MRQRALETDCVQGRTPRSLLAVVLIRSVPLPTLDTMHPMAHPSSAHHLDLVTDPCDQRKLLPERVIVVRVLNTDVGERSIPWLEVLGELGKAASAGTSQA